MEKRKEWLEIRNKVAKLHPAILLSLDLMEDDLSRAVRDTDACDARGVGFALQAAKHSVSLRKDAEHLRAASIMDEETYSKFTYELETYVNGTLNEIVERLTACICHKETR